jgi:N-acetylmuramoyl-L-alanine amidase
VRKLLGLVIIGSCALSSNAVAAEQPLSVAYPKTNHQTSADKIFFIGTAPPTGQVLINGKLISRSKSGHFAPSFPLQLGENLFIVRYQDQEIQLKIIRTSIQAEIPQGLAFAKNSLIPAVDIAKLPGEPICFGAIASPQASVSVKLGNQMIPLSLQPPQSQLAANSAALTGKSQTSLQNVAGNYQGCMAVEAAGDLGQPQFQLTLNGKTTTQPGTGKIQILSPVQLPVAEVTAESGVARTGPSTDYSRLTPLPKGTRTAITGREGEWLRLDYGAWINGKETRTIPGAVAPRSMISSLGYHKRADATEIVFPLQAPVPISVQQSDRAFNITLYNTTAQTDTFRTDDSPLISRLDWRQVAPGQVQYTFNLKKDQQWGYKLRYDGTSLVLTLRHAPALVSRKRRPLVGTKILVDPGHGGKESGAPGPTGYLEKDVNLIVSRLLRDELVKRGATVVMTRQDDKEVSLVDRMAIIEKEEPIISISIHYNSLPDNGDLENTKGIGTFWYHPQAHSLALYLHNYLVKKLGRPDYGVFWNNLALTRPAAAPSVLLELGFMTNPTEFEWVTNDKEQKKLAKTLADGIVEWFKSVK